MLEAFGLLEKVYTSAATWQKYVQLLELKLKFTAETERAAGPIHAGVG